MHFSKVFGSLLTVTGALLSGVAASVEENPKHGAFSYNNSTFLLHGKPYQIIGGQMDPQRVPRAYWRQRLQMARAMGLNTIFSYMFWNNLEPKQGDFDFDGQNDVAEYFKMAQEEGLHIVLRPGPYVCGEHDWGGFPAWLNEIPGMAVRQYNQPFLEASSSYIARLGDELRSLQVTNGGPILMVQLENEYGSFGSDKQYLSALASILRNSFDLFLYSNDGGGESYLDGGSLHGVLAETDGDPKVGFAARDQYVTDPTSLGPQLDGEYYVTWFDAWASNYTYETDAGDSAATQQVVSDLEWILSGNNSFSLYMFHGGTNWRFDNGGIWGSGFLNAVTTSYDYGAPLDESGRPAPIYSKIRDTISKYVPANSIPAVPEIAPLAVVPEFELEPVQRAFDTPEAATVARRQSPLTMEDLGQSYGYTLYEHVTTKAVSGYIFPGDSPRDRVIVYVNGARVGVIDRTYTAPAKVHVSLKKGDLVQLLVENLGRVDYASELLDQRKGIVGQVTINNSTVLSEWAMSTLEFSQLPEDLFASSKNCQVKPNDTPVFYRGQFYSSGAPGQSSDTFLQINNAIKVVVWVNGANLGRYWTIGPQQSLYLPGCFLRPHGQPNEVVVLELEPQTGKKLSAQGLSTRKWFNNPDPDAP